MEKIKLEEILNNNCPYGHKWSSFLLPDQMEFMKSAMKEACRQTLKRASEKAKIKRSPYFDLSENEQIECSEVYYFDNDVPLEGIVVDKQSILATINDVE